LVINASQTSRKFQIEWISFRFPLILLLCWIWNFPRIIREKLLINEGVDVDHNNFFNKELATNEVGFSGVFTGAYFVQINSQHRAPLFLKLVVVN